MSFDPQYDGEFNEDEMDHQETYPWEEKPQTGQGSSAQRFLVIGLAVGIALVGAMMVFLIGGGLTNQPVAQDAIAQAVAHRGVQQALGEPIEAGRMINGEYSEGPLSGEATMRIALKGSERNGVLHLDARKENGTWVYYTLAVEVKGTKEIITIIDR